LVGESEGVIAGFICVGVDSQRLFKEIIFKKGFFLMIPLFRYIFNLSIVKKILENIFYPAKFGRDLPKAEILSVAVSNKAKGLGVGGALMTRTITELKNRKLYSVKALTDEANETSNRYYIKHGFKLVDKIKHHDHYLNLYVLELAGNEHT
jgi:ribosomal protein S18 acetylase RimI-like enzyme